MTIEEAICLALAYPQFNQPISGLVYSDVYYIVQDAMDIIKRKAGDVIADEIYRRDPK